MSTSVETSARSGGVVPPAQRGSGPPDPPGVAAVDLARAAATEAAGGPVGEHQGVVAEAARVVTHFFATAVPGYAGWRWAVTVARASRRTAVTVDEVALLPGPDALLAPPWVPWAERLEAGDLSPGDTLPRPATDARLVPGYLDSGDPAVDDVATEIGLGREKVLSPDGRVRAAERWWTGDTGPRTAMASHAPAQCGTCGFYLPLAGSLRAAFGVCGNEYGAGDSRVVTATYGCGAHSDVVVEEDPAPIVPGEVYDDGELEILD